MSNDVAATATTQREIPGALEGLDRQIEILTKVVEDICIRVEPVLSVKPGILEGGSKSPSVSEPARCQVAARMHKVIDQLVALRTRLDVTAQRIQA